MRLSLGVAAALIVFAVAAGSASARPLIPAQKKALNGINQAAKKGRIDPASAARYRAAVNRAARLIRRLPRARSAPISVSLKQAAAMSGKLNAPRARAVFGQLDKNNFYFALHGPPVNQRDVTDVDGVVYRYFPGRCLEFHPLANFGALNAAVSSGNATKADRLARALIDRGVSRPGGGKVWEYYFNYSGGKAPWLSGMAQAVAAQALSGAADIVESETTSLLAAARGAYRSIPGRLVRRVGSGPWIRLYSFNRLAVINAQLQAVISLNDYADLTGDESAYEFASALAQSAAASLARFDTGYWTYYSLSGRPSPLSYQRYVVQMLRRLALNDTRFTLAATRIAAYEKQAPAFKIVSTSAGAVRFWLSKPASVELRSAAGATKRLSLRGGWYKLGWKLPKKAGAYAVSVKARDWAGNSASFTPLPIVRVVSSDVWKVTGARASQAKSVLDAAEAGVASKAASTATTSLGRATFTVGAGLNLGDLTQLSTAAAQGMSAVRYSHLWPGTSTPDPTLIEALRNVPPDKRLILELVADPLPSDESGRSALAAYASSVAAQLPGIRDLLLGPVPTSATAEAYVTVLGSIYDAVKPVAPTLAVAAELDGGAAPRATLISLADAYGLTSRSVPIMDELAFRPAPAAKTGAWTVDNYPQLSAVLAGAFSESGQPVSSLPILIDGIAAATTIPVEEIGAYPAPVAGVGEITQASAYNQALRSAVCMANVSGVVFRRLVDYPGTAEPNTSDQSGLYYADGSAKTSASGVRNTTLSATRGILRVCPGLGVPVLASPLVYPLQISTVYPPRVMLACTRDCLYLVTLERADGKPVRAKRGALRGGTKPAVVRLPRGSALAADNSYRLRVRLVAKTNPGPIKQYRSPVLTLG